MGYDIKTLKDALALVRRVWRDSAGFFLSLEVWLMVAVAACTVAGVWLGFMGDLRGVLALGFAAAYLVARTVLHARRILAWPFL
jgi:hypothetical protein